MLFWDLGDPLHFAWTPVDKCVEQGEVHGGKWQEEQMCPNGTGSLLRGESPFPGMLGRTQVHLRKLF